MRVARAFAGATVLLLAAPAAADLLQLKDGRVIDGIKMEKLEGKILLKYENGTVPVSLDLVEDYVIEGVDPFEPKTDEERAKRSEGLVRWKGRWVRVEQRDKAYAKEKAAREAALAEHKQHQEWKDRYQFSTKNFEFESTLAPHINEEYSQLLETYFAEFSKLWKTRVPKDWGRLKVGFHRDMESFHQVGGAGGGVLAYYRFVPPRELHFFHDRAQPANTLAAMFHEANHYLTDLMDEDFQYPHWINEAMAEYYGSAQWDPDKNRMTIGHLQLGRLAEVRADIDASKRLALVDLIGSEDGDYRHYYWGWCFVHFMLETPKYEKNFRGYFADLARARSVDRKARPFGRQNFKSVSGETCIEHFKKKMKVKDLQALEDEWYAYVDGLEDTGVTGLERAGMQAYRQGRYRFRAPRLLKEAIDGGSRDSKVFISYAKCLMLKGEGQEAALEIFVQACEVAPLDPNTWANRGYHLLTMNRAEEGERFIALAKEMDPDSDFLDLEVARLLGQKGKDE